jgi:4-alpha-glucanotransferase
MCAELMFMLRWLCSVLSTMLCCSLQPHLFRMDKSTGSPPDFFDSNGQNWGFPTYNWEAMAEEGYSW